MINKNRQSKIARARPTVAGNDKAIRFGVALICFVLALFMLLAKPLRAEPWLNAWVSAFEASASVDRQFH